MDSPPPGVTPLIPADNAPPPIPSSSTGEAAALPPSNSGALPSPPSPPSEMSKETLTALVVGICLGGLIVLIAVGIFVFFYKRKKRKLAQEFMLPTKHNSIGGQAQENQYNVPPSINDVVHQQSKSDPPPGTLPKLQSPQSQCAIVPMSSSLGSEGSHQAQPSGLSLSSLPCLNGTFTFEELASATHNFSSTNLLGQGGFGYVHKGVLPNGKEIAVKQLKTGSVQGEREFQAEVETISRVHHRHLVSLVGHCMCGEQRMLVYEFIPNKTLEYHLHGEELPPMSWPLRLKIALGAAKGLAYLHEDCHPKIIHRDIKASNILIDNEFEAKVADFGLAKFSFDTDTHVSTRVMGTFGYLAPEYASSGKLTEKSDVFSFGVVLLELITGRRPVDKARPFMDDSMVEWARPLLTQALEGGSFNELVDRRLEEYDSSEMAQMIACAAVCVRSSARRRPLMSQVVRALEGNLSAEDLLKEIAPDNRTFHGSSDYDSSAQYKENLKKFRKLAFESQEQSTGEYSVFTNEHGAPPSSSSTENQHDTQEIETGKSKTGTTDVVIPVE